MAKKKKTVSRPRRRGRVGFVGGAKTSNLLQLTGGGILGGVLVNMLGNTISDKVSPTVLSGLKVGAGLFVAARSKTPIVQGAGIGAMITGGTELARSTGMMSGLTNPFLSSYTAGAYALSGVDAPSEVQDESALIQGIISDAQFDASGFYVP